MEKNSDSLGDAAGKQHWAEAWRGVQPQLYPGPEFEFSPLLERYLPRDESLLALEIGAMPGNNLVYLNKSFGYRVHAIDYLEDLTPIKKTFELNGISRYEIFQGDVFTFAPTKLYDVVFSSGFVEHFDDYEEVFKSHVRLAKPGGYVVIFVPNTKNLHWLMMRIFCPKLLAVHRTHLMSRRVLEGLSRKHDLDVLYCDYLKTYRAFYPVPGIVALVNRIVVKALRILHLGDLPNAFASPFIYLIARRRANGPRVSAADAGSAGFI